jgi:hypothetical protein
MSVASMSAPARALPAHRVLAAIVAAAALSMLVVGASLRPDPRGVETHTQLGLWPCGWYLATGYPCPTCGMTTAVSAASHGQYGLSVKTQPFGAFLALVAAVVFWAGVHVALFGSRLGAFSDRLLRPRVMIILAAIFVAAWLYKIAAVRGL